MGVTSCFFTGFDTAPQEGICVYLVSGLGRSQALGEATVTVSPKHHDVPIRVTSMPTDQCRCSLWPVPSGQNSYCSGQHTANDDCWIPSHDWDIIWPPLSTAWGTPQYKEKGGGRGADSSARHAVAVSLLNSQQRQPPRGSTGGSILPWGLICSSRLMGKRHFLQWGSHW